MTAVRTILTSVCAAASLTLLGLSQAQAQSEQNFFGDYEFRSSCAACHGLDGKGGGPVASQLNPKPSDLTVLSKNNGGEFPYEKVFQMIDGRGALAAHGSGVMPVWGDRYSLEVKQPIVRARILELTYYLRSIQQ